MSVTSFDLLTSKEMSLGDFSRVEFFNGCIKTWSTIKDYIAITSVFNKLFLSSREWLLLTLDSFKYIFGVSQESGDATGVAVEEIFPTVINQDRSSADSALIQ